MSETLRVELGPRSYDIIIGEGLLGDAGKYVAPLLRKPRVIIVTDETVARLHLQALTTSLSAHNIAHQHLILPAGEQTKSFAELEHLLERLLAFSPDRNTTLVALGGGVIGDITGFAASILLRGVDFIQMPTTLLAQVDSSVGGKTGINSHHGKNLIGSFYQPKLVLADISTLATLPRRELLAGYAEVVKYGIIHDEPFFSWLEANGVAALAGDTANLTHMVLESCKAKADIVSKDEREAGIRALLNFGHTLGHALEAECGFSDQLLHGEAVAIGMALALRLSVMKGVCAEQDYARVMEHYRQVGLPTLSSFLTDTLSACVPTEPPPAGGGTQGGAGGSAILRGTLPRPPASGRGFTRETLSARLIEHCHHDKKALGGRLTFILARKIGNSFISHDVTKTELEALLAESI